MDISGSGLSGVSRASAAGAQPDPALLGAGAQRVPGFSDSAVPLPPVPDLRRSPQVLPAGAQPLPAPAQAVVSVPQCPAVGPPPHPAMGSAVIAPLQTPFLGGIALPGLSGVDSVFQRLEQGVSAGRVAYWRDEAHEARVRVQEAELAHARSAVNNALQQQQYYMQAQQHPSRAPHFFP